MHALPVQAYCDSMRRTMHASTAAPSGTVSSSSSESHSLSHAGPVTAARDGAPFCRPSIQGLGSLGPWPFIETPFADVISRAEGCRAPRSGSAPMRALRECTGSPGLLSALLASLLSELQTEAALLLLLLMLAMLSVLVGLLAGGRTVHCCGLEGLAAVSTRMVPRKAGSWAAYLLFRAPSGLNPAGLDWVTPTLLAAAAASASWEEMNASRSRMAVSCAATICTACDDGSQVCNALGEGNKMRPHKRPAGTCERANG